MFSSRSQVKFFLTIVGDNILKKHNDYIFLIKPKTKKYLVELETSSHICLGINNITHNFMSKFHENYTYNNCRLLKINDIMLLENWNTILKQIGLDILYVAMHYSTRYENSDNYIANYADDELKNYTLLLQNSNQTEILNNFCKYSITTSSTGASLNWKNMHFIWKKYISTFSLPNVIYSNTLKTLLREKYEFDETTDTFKNITSKYLPNISDFIQFWDKNIIMNTAHNNDFDNEFEIDELCNLYKSWTQTNAKEIASNGNITESDVLKIISHFFQNVEIIENKYVLDISCILWNKITDLNLAIEEYKIGFFKETTSLVHFDELYDYYAEYCKKMNIKYIVSKRYFEKYLYVSLSDYIEYDKFINPAYFCT